MIDFAAVPPEVTSSQLYAGPGAGPMIEAATAWGNLATDLISTVNFYGSVVTSLSTVWLGPSAEAMRNAFGNYMQTLVATAEQCAQTASAASAAASAFEQAFATVVPPMVIAANRMQLMILVATNILGQNTPAIMANESQYAEFWAQDAAAMYAYAASSSAATSALPQFTPPESTAKPVQATQPTAQPATSITDILDALFGNGTTTGQNWQAVLQSGAFTQLPSDMLLGLLALMTADTVVIEQQQSAAMAERMSSMSMPTYRSPYGSPYTGRYTQPSWKPVEARVGVAPQVQKLSVPPGWTTPPPAPNTTVQVLPPKGRFQMGFPVPPAVPVVTAGRSSQNRVQRSDPEFGTVSKILPARHPSAG